MATKGSTKKSNGRSTRSAAGRRGSGKRDLVESRNASFYARRDAGGQFREMDEQGRSLASDRRRRAKTAVKPGYGDRGDRKSSSRAR
jgi:hypothetical protein